jgi:hypothetical protein
MGAGRKPRNKSLPVSPDLALGGESWPDIGNIGYVQLDISLVGLESEGIVHWNPSLLFLLILEQEPKKQYLFLLHG